MSVYDILPLMTPALVMQVLIQAYFIRHCWRNGALSKRARVLYILSIALLNIPAAAAYLFLSRKREADLPDDMDGLEGDNHIRNGVFVLLVMAYELFSLRILASGTGTGQNTMLRWLLAACFVCMIVQGLLVSRRQKALYYFLPAAQTVLAMAVDYLDKTQSSQFLVLAVVASIINGYPPRLARNYTAAAFVLYLAQQIIKAVISSPLITPDEAISHIYVNMLVFVLVFMSFYMLKKQLLANKRLKEQSLMLEEMAALSERSRITGEIHDTVGHTLTSAVIIIEAGEALLDKDIAAAREKFALAKVQVQKGLQGIRQSVKTIKAGGEKAFLPELYRLLEDSRRNMGLEVTAAAELNTVLLPIQQSVLLSAVKECITNSVKHGGSSKADLLLQEYKDTVCMTFTDNGTGTDELSFDFGLETMSARVKSIGGSLRAESARGEGFTVGILLPVGKKTGGHGE